MHRKRKTIDEKEKIKAILDRDSCYGGGLDAKRMLLELEGVL